MSDARDANGFYFERFLTAVNFPVTQPPYPLRTYRPIVIERVEHPSVSALIGAVSHGELPEPPESWPME
jgi:hypothetical protein